MTDWIVDAETEIKAWLDQTGTPQRAVERVLEGLEISRKGEIAEHARPGQAPNLFVPGLTAKPWWEVEHFDWVPGIEACTGTILEEILAFGAVDNDVAQPQFTERGRWSIIYLVCAGRPDGRGVQAFPETCKVLAQVPGALNVGMAFFSAIEGGTHISAHTGFTNAHLRCHLSLIASGESVIRVADRKRGWTEGKVMIFDDSFEHEVWNNGEKSRLVLLFDIWHPDLTGAERGALDVALTQFRKYWMRRALRGMATAA